MRILTFNHHESYIFSLAQTGHQWEVVTQFKNLALHWNKAGVPPPANVKLCDWENDFISKKVKQGYYDCVVCHTLKNLLWLPKRSNTRVIFVAHIPLFRFTFVLRFRSLVKKIIFKIFQFFMNIEFVAVSEFKRESWGVDGDVIVLAPRQLAPVTFTGSPKVVVVCNHLRERPEELGFETVDALVNRKLPIQVIGRNPNITYGVSPRSHDEFEELFRAGYVYLYTIKKPYGDGYNTAMLEAMSMGMPVVTVENSSSPIRHQENGLIGRSIDELTSHIQFLLENSEEARRIGRNARGTIEDSFSNAQFIDKWNRVLMKSS